MSVAGELVEGCTHPRAQHIHGTYVAYVKDGCRCQPCRAAASRQGKRNRIQLETGRTGFTDPQPAREHLHQLMALGITPGQIEQRSGINRTMIRYVLGWAPGRPPAHRIRQHVAAAILAVTADHLGGEDHGYVDPTGAVRRMRALVAIGWPLSTIARRIGMENNAGTIFAGNRLILASTRAAALALYDELRDTPPRPGVDVGQRQITSSLRRAQENGWAPPHLWDDDDLDDPNAEPAQEWTPARGIELEDVEWLADSGARLLEVTARTGYTADGIKYACERAERLDLWRRLTAEVQAEPRARIASRRAS